MGVGCGAYMAMVAMVAMVDNANGIGKSFLDNLFRVSL